LSYASGPLSSRKKSEVKIDSAPGTVKTWERTDRPRPAGIRPPAKRQPSGVNLSSLSGCLFPREQEVTGKNLTALPASLTGRIWFFCSTNYEPLLNKTPTKSRFLSPLSRSASSSRPTDPSGYEPYSAASQHCNVLLFNGLTLEAQQATNCAWRCKNRIWPPGARAHSPRKAPLQRSLYWLPEPPYPCILLSRVRATGRVAAPQARCSERKRYLTMNYAHWAWLQSVHWLAPGMAECYVHR